jgi:hypothetical protein
MSRKGFFWNAEANDLNLYLAFIPLHIDERHENRDHHLLGGNCTYISIRRIQVNVFQTYRQSRQP